MGGIKRGRTKFGDGMMLFLPIDEKRTPAHSSSFLLPPSSSFLLLPSFFLPPSFLFSSSS
jgi:hypothetical protein